MCIPECVAPLQLEKDQITAQLEQQLQRLSTQVSATQKHSEHLSVKLAAKQRTCMDAQQQLVRASAAAGALQSVLCLNIVRSNSDMTLCWHNTGSERQYDC